MSTVLHIESSPRKIRSRSIKVARVFLQEYTKYHPSDEIVTLDIWDTVLPEVNGDTLDSKYAILHGKEKTVKQIEAWGAVERVISHFLDADKYIFSLPMWNFGIPYKLKHFFDVIIQPGYTFSFSPEEGYKGLVKSKHACVICARGGSYTSEDGSQELDVQQKYMNLILGFIGITDVRPIIIQPTLAGDPEQLEQVLKLAEEEARTIAREF
ncbi:MAG: NAD(P)H-dependent oxidoreductase [Synergistales bacterium]|nr:NAD(P)H-dependent oxidoreductase [Synergistales bacterium]